MSEFEPGWKSPCGRWELANPVELGWLPVEIPPEPIQEEPLTNLYELHPGAEVIEVDFRKDEDDGEAA